MPCDGFVNHKRCRYQVVQSRIFIPAIPSPISSRASPSLFLHPSKFARDRAETGGWNRTDFRKAENAAAGRSAKPIHPMKTLLLAALFSAFVLSVRGESFPVQIEVKTDQSRGPLKPIWRFFGADEPNYAYMRNGSELLGHLGDLYRLSKMCAAIRSVFCRPSGEFRAFLGVSGSIPRPLRRVPRARW